MQDGKECGILLGGRECAYVQNVDAGVYVILAKNMQVIG